MYEPVLCWWCLYLKGIETLTSMRINLFVAGRNSTIPVVKSLVMCPVCFNELNISLNEQIQLIQDFKPELKDWLTHNNEYLAEC